VNTATIDLHSSLTHSLTPCITSLLYHTIQSAAAAAAAAGPGAVTPNIISLSKYSRRGVMVVTGGVFYVDMTSEGTVHSTLLNPHVTMQAAASTMPVTIGICDLPNPNSDS